MKIDLEMPFITHLVSRPLMVFCSAARQPSGPRRISATQKTGRYIRSAPSYVCERQTRKFERACRLWLAVACWQQQDQPLSAAACREGNPLPVLPLVQVCKSERAHLRLLLEVCEHKLLDVWPLVNLRRQGSAIVSATSCPTDSMFVNRCPLVSFGWGLSVCPATSPPTCGRESSGSAGCMDGRKLAVCCRTCSKCFEAC